MMITGGGFGSFSKCCCTSTPVIAGICKSSTTQSGTRSASDSRNRSGEQKASARQLDARSNRSNARQIEGSSSTIAISGELASMGYVSTVLDEAECDLRVG